MLIYFVSLLKSEQARNQCNASILLENTNHTEMLEINQQEKKATAIATQ